MPNIHTKRRLLLLAVAMSSILIIVCVRLLWYSETDKYKHFLKDRPYIPIQSVYQEKGKKLVIFQPGLEVNLFPAVLLQSYMSLADIENNFFLYLETKSVICDDNRRLGNQHDGGWNICLTPPFNVSVKVPCLVYSFGIGEDWRFEDEMYDLFRCRVMAYDPSIGLREHNRTDLIMFKPLGLGERSYVTEEKWRLKKFKQFLADEGDLETTVDYLKIDIEYMEWDVLKSLVMDNSLYNVKQIAFEIHLKHPTNTPAKDMFITKEEFLSKYHILSSLEKVNFKLFDYRMNPFCAYASNVTKLARSRCYELHYLNMNFVTEKYLKHKRDIRIPLFA